MQLRCLESVRVSFADLGVPTDAKEPTPPSPRLGFSLSRCLAVCRGHGRERLLPTGLYEVGHQAEVLWPCHDPRRGPKKTDWSVWKRWVQDGVCVWVGWGGWASGQTGVPNRWRRSDLERVCSPDRRPVARCSCGTSSRSSAEGFLGVGRWRSWPNGQGGLARVPRGADVMDL